ncbi:MAG: hypothetical protein V4530_05955 [Pseudomonadota bacterium]
MVESNPPGVTTIRKMDGQPMVHISGEISGFIEWPDSAIERTSYQVGLSDGTLLTGFVAGGFEVEREGRNAVSITDGKVTMHGPLDWAMVSLDRYSSTISTAEHRAEQDAEFGIPDV